jgi:malonyl-CoA O-methyltransferase
MHARRFPFGAWLARLWRKSDELHPLDAYALWASTYLPEAHNPPMELEQRAMLDLLPDATGRRVLDLACGSGRYLSILGERGATTVLGMDNSLPMLRHASARSLACADLLALPIADATLDLIVCGLALGHVRDLSRAIGEIGRVLKPGGVVLYSDLHPFGRWAGWRRTFHAQGREHAIEHHSHLYADHHAACQAAGLQIDAVREPRIDFEHAWRGAPAALVIRARKKHASV